MNKICPKCLSLNILNYFTKLDGEYDVEYWRCNECRIVWENKVKNDRNNI